MSTYTPTAAATLMAAGGILSSRIEIALLQKAAAVAGGATGTVKAYVVRLLVNPAGEGNAVVPLVLAIVNVAAPGTDVAPVAPLDSELATAISALWPILTA